MTDCILCVAIGTRCDELERQLLAVTDAQVGIISVSSTNEGLVLVGALWPNLVVVTHELDDMDGLEFVGRLQHRYPEFQQDIIIIPDQDDPFPAILHTVDPESSKPLSRWLEASQFSGWIRCTRLGLPDRSSS